MIDAPPAAGSDPGDAASGEPHLLLEEVGHRYRTDAGPVEALAPTTLAVEQGEFVVLVGPSGCGKTTLLRILAGLLVPTSGRVLAGGEAVRGPSPDRGVVFQQPALYPWLSVAGNVEIGLRFRGEPRRRRRARAAELLELVGLADVADARPYELSGGMQQRCQLARVLATDPTTLLLDEPFAALDAITRERLQDELDTLRRSRGVTVVFVTHAVEEAAVLGTRAVVMAARPGRVVADITLPAHECTATQRRTDPRTLTATAELRKLLDDATEPSAGPTAPPTAPDALPAGRRRRHLRAVRPWPEIEAPSGRTAP